MQSTVRTPSDIAKQLIAGSSVKIEEGNNREQSVEEIASKIKRLYFSKELVPIICEDMYEYEDPSTGNRQSLHSYIMSKLIESKTSENGNPISIKNEQELLDILSEGYFGTQLLEEKLGESLYDDIVSLVTDEKSEIREGICLKKEVEAFLRAGDFPLIITTNCFNILESRLHDLNYKPCYYELDKKDSELPSKCIYHLFGEAKSDENWGYNEKLVLRFLRSIYSKHYEPIHLTTYIQTPKRKTLLFLGNDTPDWLFRFILVPIYGNEVYDNGKGYYLKDQNRKEIVSLNHFLDNIHFVKESQLIEVLTAVTPSIAHEPIQSKGHNKKYDFFISHASEDDAKVKELIKWLDVNGIIKSDRIWADTGEYDKIGDGNYWGKIIEGITQSAYFMPIVSNHFITKTKSKKEQDKALASLGIEELTLDADKARRLNDHLDGVQVELMLASRYLKESPRDSYSIPVVIEGCEVMDEALDIPRIERWGKDSKRLPENLFYGIQMFEFDGGHPESLALDWNRYKSEEELNHGKQ